MDKWVEPVRKPDVGTASPDIFDLDTLIDAGIEALGQPSIVRRCVETMDARGRWIGARHQYLMEQHGVDALRHVANLLPATSRTMLLNPPSTFSWNPIRHVLEIDMQIFRHVMDGSLARMKAFGGDIARYDLPVAFKPLLRLANPKLLLARLDPAVQSYIRPSGAEVVELIDGRATLRFRDLFLPYYLCVGTAGWVTTALEMTGCKNVSVMHPRCMHRGDMHCEHVATWS